jgi:hypothetical protein
MTSILFLIVAFIIGFVFGIAVMAVLTMGRIVDLENEVVFWKTKYEEK